MVRSTRGLKTGTRRKLKQKKRAKFKSETFLKDFKKKEKVVLGIEPSSHKGMPFPKLKGRVGEIVEKRGNSYVVLVKSGKSSKKIIARPEHLSGAVSRNRTDR